MLSTAIIHVCHPNTQNVRQQTPSVAPSVQANLLGLTGFQMGRIFLVIMVPKMPAGLKGVKPNAAPATISKITNGATYRIGSSSGAANKIKIVVPDSTFRRPALALVAVSLIHIPHCPSTGRPIAHQGWLKKLLLLLAVESIRFTSNHVEKRLLAGVSFAKISLPLPGDHHYFR